MSNARGDDTVLLARQQAAFGTAEAASDGAFYKLPFYTASLTPGEELGEDEAIYGDAFPGEAVAGLRTLSGNMVVPMGLNSIGWHLRALLGAPTTTEIEVGKYSHVFTTAAAPAVALLTQGLSHTRIGQHFVQDSLAYSGMELQARKNSERGRMTFNMLGREEVGAAATLDSTPVAFDPDPVPVGFQGKCLVGGTETAAVTGVDMTLAAGVEADQESLNGLATAAHMDWGRWDLTGSLDARFRDRTWYDYGDQGGAFEMALKWVHGTDYELEVKAHSIRVERTGIPVDGRGIISSSFNWRTNRPAAGQTVLTVTLKNTTADYANPA